jgi:hypothetical protein
MSIQDQDPKDHAVAFGMPALPMVLVRGRLNRETGAGSARSDSSTARLVVSGGSSSTLDNETVVRRIIEHLLKEM